MDSDYELPDVCEKVDYTDGDVMIIDNVRHLEEQYQRLPSQNLIILCCKGRMQLDMNGRTTVYKQYSVECGRTRLFQCHADACSALPRIGFD